MKRILILGCGRSSSTLIEYLKKRCEANQWHLRLADADKGLAQEKAGDLKYTSYLKFDVFNEGLKEEEVKNSDLVISMLPAGFHIEVLKACIKYRKDMITASFISEEVEALRSQIDESGILVLKECGLDPGLDHMSAMEIIDHIKSKGGEISSFKSYTGGLIAPQSDNNPWRYKFTWNPRNVVLAGQGTARYINKNQLKYIPYHKLFSRTEKIFVKDYGEFEGYANRDSLSYRKIYGIENIPTLLRGTLRRPLFCSAWNIFVQLGITEDTYIIEDSENMTYRSFLNSFLPYDEQLSVEEKFCRYSGLGAASEELAMITWLGIFENKQIKLKKASPAKILQNILEEKWVLDPLDKDMIVMQHQFEYSLKGEKKSLITDLVVEGDGNINTAMAKTVGLPLAIAAKLILENKIELKGLHIPVKKELYQPILGELNTLDIHFKHHNI